MQHDSLLDGLLRSLRISGVFLIREGYRTPWAVSVPTSRELGALLGLQRDLRVVAFHYLEFGNCEIRAKNRKVRSLQAGDIAICFGGEEHTLALGAKVRAEPVSRLLRAEPRPSSSSVQRRDSGLLCGAFVLNPGSLNPLLSALPSWAVVPARRDGAKPLRDIVSLLQAEISSRGGGPVSERLIEILCLEAIRQCVWEAPAPSQGWCRGVRDAIVGKALERIHAAPEQAWSVKRLAQAVNLSPSRFAARFSEAMGTSPIAYLAEWRMHVASRILVSEDLSVEETAFRVGYENGAAFSRAFKIHLGLSPALWRSRQLPGRG